MIQAWATADAKATHHLQDAGAELLLTLINEGAPALVGISRRYPTISQLSRVQLIITGLAATPSLALEELRGRKEELLRALNNLPDSIPPDFCSSWEQLSCLFVCSFFLAMIAERKESAFYLPEDLEGEQPGLGVQLLSTAGFGGELKVRALLLVGFFYSGLPRGHGW